MVNGNSLGVGGLKSTNFWRTPRKFSMPTRRIFHRVVKDTIDRTRHTFKYMWIILICSITKIRNRCPFKKKKKNFKMFVWRPKSDLCWILLLTSNRVPLKASCLPNRLLACTQTLYYFSYRSFQKHRGAREQSERARTSAEHEKEK